MCVSTTMYRVLEERESVNERVATRWNDLTNDVELLVIDKANGRSFVQIVEAHRARDAFVHPWCYVPSPAATPETAA